MNICADLLYLELRKRCPEFEISACITNAEHPLLYSSVRFFHNSIARDHIYVLNEQQWCSIKYENNTENFLPIVVSDKEFREANNFEIIWVQSCNAMEIIFDCVQEIIDDYDAWEKELISEVSISCNIEKMLLATSELTGVPISLYDENILPLYYIDYFPDIYGDYSWHNKKTEVVSTEDFATIHHSYDFSKPEKGIFFRDLSGTNDDGSSSLGYNMYKGNHYLGCTVMRMDHRNPRQADRFILTILTQNIEKCLTHSNYYGNSSSDQIHKALLSMVKGESIDHVTVENIFNQWQTDSGKLWVCILAKQNDDVSTLPKGYLCHHIETNYERCLAVVVDDSVCVFHRITSEDDFLQVTGRLKQLFETIHYRAGISMQYYDIIDTHGYYQQALYAVKNGIPQDPELIFYTFYSSLYKYLIENGTKEFSPRFLLPRSLQRIKEHDAESNTSYWDTLSCYLDNEMNATKTSEQLFIHRSSFLQRMSHIEKMMGEDLSTPEKRLVIRMIIAANKMK